MPSYQGPSTSSTTTHHLRPAAVRFAGRERHSLAVRAEAERALAVVVVPPTLDPVHDEVILRALASEVRDPFTVRAEAEAVLLDGSKPRSART